MTTQLILLGSRRPDSDDDYKAYASVAGPILVGAGGIWNSQYDRVSNLAGDGPEQVRVMDLPDEDTIRAVFASPEYQSVIPHRDRAFEQLRIIVATPTS
jgi:uncharacterized protein (DUF1330 family)